MQGKTEQQAFTGLAKNYNKARPSYPTELLTAIRTFFSKLSPMAVPNSNHIDSIDVGSTTVMPVIADIGCGTGISTRAIFDALSKNCTVIGIEPGTDMLTAARHSSPEEITYIEAPAESLPLEPESVDIITAAQAAQWFDRPAFYAEARRVLKPNGVIAIYENNRDWQNSAFLETHEAFLESYSIDMASGKKYSRHYRDFPYEAELSENFADAHTQAFPWTRKMTPHDFLLMAQSSTQVKRAEENIGRSRLEALILANATKHSAKDQQVEVNYRANLYMARK